MIERLSNFAHWVQTHPAVIWWSGAVSLAMFLGTLVAVPVLLVKMPEDYFTTSRHEKLEDWRGEHPLLRWSARILKNVLGTLLVILGLLLLVLPGQGLLTILLGITLLDLPGKRRLEVALLRQRGVARAVNWLRRKYNRPPLEMPRSSSGR